MTTLPPLRVALLAAWVFGCATGETGVNPDPPTSDDSVANSGRRPRTPTNTDGSITRAATHNATLCDRSSPREVPLFRALTPGNGRGNPTSVGFKKRAPRNPARCRLTERCLHACFAR